MNNGLPFSILVVDDDADDRMIIDEAFQEIGYEAEGKKFIDGKALLYYLEQIEPSLYPSLIVLDNILPALEAADILSILKGNSSYGHIPVVIYTTFLSPSKKEQLLAMGAYACFERDATMHDVVQMAANFRYLYKSGQKPTKGRPRLYDGKVDTGAIDKRRIRCCYKDKEVKIYAGVVYAVQLKRKVLVAFVYYRDKEQPEIILSTDTQMDTLTMCRYYGLRFQVEFLIRDAKQYAGMEDCQARSERKLHTHSNVALTAVSLVKAVYYLALPKEKRGSFSMRDIKMLHMNQLLTSRIFVNLDLDLSDRKIKQLYNQCLNFGRVYPDRSGLRA